MEYTLTKANGKYKCFPEFKHVIYVEKKTLKYIDPVERKQRFFALREWCWETWGPSKELNDWLLARKLPDEQLVSQNQHWCWQNDEYYSRIFLRDDPDLAWLMLRWS